MNAVETSVGILFAIVLVGVAAYFSWRQRLTLRSLHTDLEIKADQRRYLFKQCQRRLFGSFLMILLAGMIVGALFLDYDPLQNAGGDVAQADREAAKPVVRFLVFYFMSMLMLVLVILLLAVLDFWATARFGVQMQKQLLREHQEMLEAELEEHRHRRTQMN